MEYEFRRAVRANRLLAESGYEDFCRAMGALKFYKNRVEELEKNKKKFPEPYYTMVCNILANGKVES